VAARCSALTRRNPAMLPQMTSLSTCQPGQFCTRSDYGGSQ